MAESLNIDVSKFVENVSMENIEKKYASNVLMKMLTEGLHTDITLKAEKSCVNAHRCVLAGASSVFHAMFKHGMKEHHTSTVEISDMSMECLQLFLVLLFITNERNDAVPEFEAAVNKHSLEFFQASYKYDVADRLKCILAKSLRKVLTSDNCWDYCSIISVQKIGFVELFDFGFACPRGRPEYVCIMYILNSFDEVFQSNSALQEMKRNPEHVWTLIKMRNKMVRETDSSDEDSPSRQRLPGRAQVSANSAKRVRR